MTREQQYADRVKTIRALAESVRASLGDQSKSEQTVSFLKLFARQCERLVAHDAEYAQAIRDAVLARVGPLTPDKDVREKVLTDTEDIFHPYWLLMTSDFSLRNYVRSKSSGSPEGLDRLAGIIGMIVSGQMPPGFGGESGPEDDNNLGGA